MQSFIDRRRSVHARLRACAHAVVALACLLYVLMAVAQPQDAQPAAEQAAAPVVTLSLKGAIGVGAGMQVEQAVDLARERKAALLLITLDTPGGLVTTTRDIIQSILGSPVPVAVYVAPSGARAASAGTYIVYAAHIAAMAPGTSIGAATPVAMQGPMGGPPPDEKPEPEQKKQKPKSDENDKRPAPDSAMERKSLNDAIAFLRSLAQLRGRNIEWADEAVRDAATLTGKEAASMNVVDLLADNEQALLDALHGRSVKTSAGDVKIATRGAERVAAEPSLRIRLLAAVADPNVAFILLLLGIYGLIFEFWNPGTGVTGVIGAVCLLLALTALSMLPVHYGGLALLLLGLALMTAEAFTPGIGVLGIGGLIAFVIGSIFLFDPAGSDFDIGVALPLILGAAATSAAMFFFVLGAAMRARRGPVSTGGEQMLHARGVVREWHGREGVVQLYGEAWRARSDRELTPGVTVEVTAREGLVLDVRPLNESS